MKKFLLIFVLVVCLSGSNVFAETDKTTGFIPGSIWYSTEPLIEGETVKIYTAVWNGGDKQLQAHVDFYDKNVLLGGRDIVVEKTSLKEVSISWKVTSGDHTISAKISSSTISTAGKAEKVSLERTSTTSDKKFVPVAVKTVDGTTASSSDVVKSEVSKATSKIADVVPTPVAEFFSSIDVMRTEVDTKIDISKSETKKEIESFSNPFKPDISDYTEDKPLDATEKPIAYIKLFLLSIVGFIFGSQIVFYGLAIAITFWLLRFIYRKIRNRR